MSNKKKATKELTDLEAEQQRRLKRARTREKKQDDDVSSASPRGLNPPVDSDLTDTKDQGDSSQQPVPTLRLRLGLRPESPTQYPTDEQSQSPIARRSSRPISRPRARSKSPEIQRGVAASPFGPPPQLLRASTPANSDDDESQLPQASADVKDADVRRGQIPVSQLRLEFERPQSSQQPVALRPALGSQDTVQAISQLIELKQQLEEINKTLEETKTSDTECKEALEKTRNQLTACRGELKKLNETYEALASTKTELEKKDSELVKQRALSAALVADKNALIAKNIRESKALETKLQQEIDECKESLRIERETSEKRKEELDEGFGNFQKLAEKFKKQTERMESLEQDLQTTKEKKKGLAKELQAERERKPDVDKEDLFWTLFLDPGFPKGQWQPLRLALLPETKDITEQVIKDRLKEMKAPLHLLDSKEVSDLKVQLRAVQDELERLKKEKEDLSKAVVRRRSPSPSSDMKDDSPSTALVRRKRGLSDCEEDLQQARTEILALDAKIDDLTQAHNIATAKLKGDIQKLKDDNYALRTENDGLKRNFDNIDEDTKARLEAIEDCDNDRAKLREQLVACAKQRDKLQADLDQCEEELKKALTANKSFLNIQNDLKAAQAVQAKCEEELKKAMAANDTFVGIREDLKAEKKARAKDKEDFEEKLEIAQKDFQTNKKNLTNMHSDLIADEQKCRRELKASQEELAKCKEELEACLGAKDGLDRKFQGLSATAQQSIALRNEAEKMVAFMDSFIQNLTARAVDTDIKRLEERTNLQIAKAEAALGEFKLGEVMKKIQRLVIQLRAREAEQIRLVETLRRSDYDRDVAKYGEAKAKDLKLDSQIQSRGQILADANKMLNKTACNFIEDSLEYLISGSPYVASGLSGHAEKKEAAMFYIHALCAEPHWAFLVARYLGKDYNMAYPLSAHLQLVLMDESEQYRPRGVDRYDRSHTGWFSSGRRAKVIRVLNAFMIDMHYHRGMRERRRNHGRPLDTVDPRELSVGLPDAAWVMERIGFWTVPDAKEIYSDEEKVTIATEIIRAYQIFDLFDLDTSAPPVEIGWQAFLTDGDAQSKIAMLVTEMVHKRVDGNDDDGHELIWGTIRNNPSLLRYWRYEYPEPLVLLLPLWNYIMHVLDNGLVNLPFKQHAERLLQAHGHLRDFFQFLPKLKQKLVQQ